MTQPVPPPPPPDETPEQAAARTGHFVGCTCEQCPSNLPVGTDPGDN